MVLCLSKQEKRKIKTIRIHFTLPETTTLFVLQRFFLSCGNRKMNSCPHMQKKRHSCIEWNIIKGGNLYTYHHLLFRFGWKCVFFFFIFFYFFVHKDPNNLNQIQWVQSTHPNSRHFHLFFFTIASFHALVNKNKKPKCA